MTKKSQKLEPDEYKKIYLLESVEHILNYANSVRLSREEERLFMFLLCNALEVLIKEINYLFDNES